jgi:hypothetical protein
MAQVGFMVGSSLWVFLVQNNAKRMAGTRIVALNFILLASCISDTTNWNSTSEPSSIGKRDAGRGRDWRSVAT